MAFRDGIVSKIIWTVQRSVNKRFRSLPEYQDEILKFTEVPKDIIGISLTLPMRKRRGFLRGTHSGALYSQGVSQTPPIQSPEGLWLLDVMVRRILLTSGLDDAIHFTSPTICERQPPTYPVVKGRTHS